MTTSEEFEKWMKHAFGEWADIPNSLHPPENMLAAFTAGRESERKLIEKLNEYIEFLNDANQDPISFAFAHGWRAHEDTIAKGIKLRSEIADIESRGEKG